MTPGAFLCRPSPLFRSGFTRAVCRRLIILQQTPQRMVATAPCILIQRACCSYCCANELSLRADAPPLCHFPNNCCGVKIISFGGGGKQADASRLQGKIERRFTSCTSLDVSCVWVVELKKNSTSLLPPLGLTSRRGQAGTLNKACTDLFAPQEFPTQLINDAWPVCRFPGFPILATSVAPCIWSVINGSTQSQLDATRSLCPLRPLRLRRSRRTRVLTGAASGRCSKPQHGDARRSKDEGCSRRVFVLSIQPPVRVTTAFAFLLLVVLGGFCQSCTAPTLWPISDLSCASLVEQSCTITALFWISITGNLGLCLKTVFVTLFKKKKRIFTKKDCEQMSWKQRQNNS